MCIKRINKCQSVIVLCHQKIQIYKVENVLLDFASVVI